MDTKLPDFENRPIRLTFERRRHILKHPEMARMLGAIAETLRSPECVIRSASDERAQLYYRYYLSTAVGEKYLCVIVKVSAHDAFVVTAYLTDAIKKGVILWPRNQ